MPLQEYVTINGSVSSICTNQEKRKLTDTTVSNLILSISGD